MVSGSTTEAMNVLRNVEELSCNQCCCGKAVSITKPWRVFVALGTQHAMRMRHVVFCGQPGSTMTFRIVS